MMNRRNIDYEEIVEIGLNLLKEEADVIYGTEEKDKAESALRMVGIVDFLYALNKATEITTTFNATTTPAICPFEETE